MDKKTENIKTAFVAVAHDIGEHSRQNPRTKARLLASLRRLRSTTDEDGFRLALKRECGILVRQTKDWLSLVDADIVFDAMTARDFLNGKNLRESLEPRTLGFFLSRKQELALKEEYEDQRTITLEVLRTVGSMSNAEPRLSFVADLIAYSESGWAAKDKAENKTPWNNFASLSDIDLVLCLAKRFSELFAMLKKGEASSLRHIVSPDGKTSVIPHWRKDELPEDEWRAVVDSTRRGRTPENMDSPLLLPLTLPEVEQVIVIPVSLFSSGKADFNGEKKTIVSKRLHADMNMAFAIRRSGCDAEQFNEFLVNMHHYAVGAKSIQEPLKFDDIVKAATRLTQRAIEIGEQNISLVGDSEVETLFIAISDLVSKANEVRSLKHPSMKPLKKLSEALLDLDRRVRISGEGKQALTRAAAVLRGNFEEPYERLWEKAN